MWELFGVIWGDGMAPLHDILNSVSYDVKALFTSVPMDPSIQIIQQKLQ